MLDVTDSNHGEAPSGDRWRWFWRSVILVMVIGIAAAAWIGIRGWQARTALTTAIPQVEQLQRQVLAGDQTGARVTLAALQERTERARVLTSDPVWSLVAHVPWAGRSLGAIAIVARGVDDLADQVMPPVVESAGSLDLSALQPVDGRIDLAPIAAAGPLISQASSAAEEVATTVGAIDTDGLLDLVSAPVSDVQDRVSELALTLRTGERATRLLPPMLGADGPRRYLLLLQTNAELRATGGMPGAMSVITADDGVVAMTEQVAAIAMPRYDEPVLDLSAADEALYTNRLGRYMSDVNLTPNFPTTAALALEMWRLHTGEQLDGVLATDPVALSYVLGATGPVDDGVGGQLSSADAVHVLLSAAYSRYPNIRDQDAFFAGVASGVFNAVAAGRGQPAATVSALARAAGEHRLLVWSARPVERAELEGTVLTGAMPVRELDGQSSVGVFFNDGTGSKMDYYLDTDVELIDTRCESGVTVHTVRITLASHAPADGATSLPASVTGPGTFGAPKGSIATNVVIIATMGGDIAGLTRDGHQLSGDSHSQANRAATVVSVELGPGEHSVLEVRLTDPSRASTLGIWSTPTRDKTGSYRESLSTTAQC